MHKIILPNQWKSSRWSGGTTSELFILPKEASFKKGDYSLRISIATVEVEESIFTPLENVDRVLTVLDGEIELIHEGHHSSVLKQYEQDCFKGDWSTKSKGKVRDFNVMTKNKRVKTTVIKISENEIYPVKKEEFFFVAEGKVTFNNKEIGKNTSFIVAYDDEFKTNAETVLICVM